MITWRSLKNIKQFQKIVKHWDSFAENQFLLHKICSKVVMLSRCVLVVLELAEKNVKSLLKMLHCWLAELVVQPFIETKIWPATV